MKNALIIGYVWPEPKSSAAGSRMVQLITALQHDGFSITYASPAAASEHAIDFSAHGITPANIELNNSSFDDFIRQLNPQLVMFDRFMMEEQFAWRVEKHCPQALRILDTEDLHCLRYARQQLAKGNDQVIGHVDKSHLYSEQAKREVAAILRCDLTLMISRHEMEILQQQFNVPDHILMYLPFMIEAKESTQALGFEQRQHFVSIGNFRHEPNWDAVLQLKKNIWPLIRKQLPKAQLHVYGAYPPKKATQLHNEKQGFLVKGWCEDAFKVLQQAKVLLAPLRFGAGLKGKMLDAAQCNLPAVTTSIGAEGLFTEGSLTAEKQTCRISDDWQAFAAHAIELHEQKEHWQALSEQGPEWIKANFNWQAYSQAFRDRLHQIEAQLDEHRLNNFTGAMLRHHSLKSTQYMAQWIEAKNKLLKPSDD